MVQYAFDASRVQPAEAGAAIWEGVVPMIIKRTEVSDTAAKNGNKMLILHVDAAAGEYQGQSNVIRLNLWNSNPQAVEVAQRQLSSICHCTGRMQIQDSDQLINGMLLGVWAKEEREINDQQTGISKKVPSCQCKDFKLPDGRTIKEAVAGQPASMPYSPGTPAPSTNSAQQALSQQTLPPQPQGGPTPGFQPAGGPSPQGAPPIATGGFAPAGGYAPAPAGGAPAPAAPGISTAGSPYSPGGAPPAPGGGYQPGPAPGAAPQGGFVPQPAPGGFPQPQGGGGFPQPGAPQAQYHPQPDPNAQYQPQGGAPQQQYQPQAGGQPPFPGGQPQPGPWGR